MLIIWLRLDTIVINYSTFIDDIFHLWTLIIKFASFYVSESGKLKWDTFKVPHLEEKKEWQGGDHQGWESEREESECSDVHPLHQELRAGSKV